MEDEINHKGRGGDDANVPHVDMTKATCHAEGRVAVNGKVVYSLWEKGGPGSKVFVFQSSTDLNREGLKNMTILGGGVRRQEAHSFMMEETMEA